MARYELIIKVENTGEKQNMTTSIPNSTNRTNNRVKIAGEDKLKEISANAAENIAFRTLTNVVSTGASMIYSQHTQDKINFTISAAQTVANIALMTATMGAAGLVLGIAQPLIQLGVNAWRYDYDYRLENESLNIARQRAGFQFNQSRRGS